MTIRIRIIIACIAFHFSCLSVTADDIKTCEDSESNSASPQRPKHKKHSVFEPQCVYYLAPSSIPNSGFGTFTVRDIPAMTPLMKQADAPTIIVSDYARHNELNSQRISDIDTFSVHHNYFWDGIGMADFEIDGKVEESVTTFGAIANYHPYLFNLFPAAEEIDDTITPRASGSPGMGAYSYNMGYNYETNRRILAGEELFTNYGEPWLDVRSYCDKVPRKDDFVIGASVIEKMISAGLQSHDLNDILIASTRNIVSVFNERAAMSLPTSVQGFSDILNQFSPKYSTTQTFINEREDIALALAKKSLIPYPVEDIVAHGQCLDHLMPDVSTLKDAGRGAFAQRFIPKGSSVVPAPVIQIDDASGLNMYDLETGKRVGTQLMINYCFSHPGTSMLLCPQSNAILINHCSIRSLGSYGGDCEKYNSNKDESMRGPNAYVRWAVSWDPETVKALNMTLAEIREKTRQGKRVLTMEIIASRDIYPGDEVFIDYGEKWEEAWDTHVRSWIHPSSATYVPIKQMNDKVINLKTPEELKLQPYPENVRLGCTFNDEDDDEEEEDDGEERGRSWVTTNDRYMRSSDANEYWPCVVLARSKSGPEGIYMVEILQSPSREQTWWNEQGMRRIINKFPRRLIKFRPNIRSSDHYLDGVFRHPLGIPDDMILTSWMSSNGN